MNAPANISLRYSVYGRGFAWDKAWYIYDNRLERKVERGLTYDEAHDMAAYLEALPEPRSVDDYPAQNRAAGEAERKSEEGIR